MKIGIVGQGFVGTAIKEGLAGFHSIKTYDINPELCDARSLSDLVDYSSVIFTCLPTPMRRGGECDVRIVSSVIAQIDEIAAKLDTTSPKIIVIKSTVPPGTTQRLHEECKNIDIIFSPEFLTEANSFDDFKNQNRIILGGPRRATTRVKTMFRKAFPKASIIKTGSRTAEMVKYFTNCFLATKISFANEIKQGCDALDIDYDKVVEYALYDDRLGRSHWSVPGPDGDLGFGGHCFPKDLNAMIEILKKNDIDPLILQATWAKNNEVRSDNDWEKMTGRAVVED